MRSEETFIPYWGKKLAFWDNLLAQLAIKKEDGSPRKD